MGIPSSNIGLRRATSTHLPQVLAMMEAFNAGEGIPWRPADVRPAVSRLLDDPSLGVIGIIETGGRTAGYFVLTWGFDLEWCGRDAFLTELYLQPAARGQAMGARALAFIEDLARAEGAAALHLMVRPENEAAVRLYGRAGYTEPPRTFLSKELRRAETAGGR